MGTAEEVEEENGSRVGSVSTCSSDGVESAEAEGVAGGKGGRGGEATVAGKSLFEDEMVEVVVI